MSLRIQVVALMLLLPACGSSCGCGTETPTAEKPAGALSDGQAAAATPSDSRSVDGVIMDEKLEAMRSKLTPMPEGEEREELSKVASAIEVTKDLGEPLEPERFVGVLPDKVGSFRAAKAAETGSTPAELGRATVVARQYRSGKSVMHVKVTDTADAPGLRRELAEQLTMVGNAPSGDQKGRIEDGIAGAVAYRQDAHASRAMALLAGRFFVEVMVQDAPSPDAAWQAVQALDAKALPR